MVRQVNELLKELGWTDGFHVPVADDENKKLEKQVEDLLKQKAEIILNLDAVKESVTALQRQFKNCENEEMENQNMLIARHGQLEMEYTRCRLSESELNKLTQDINHIDKELAEFGKKQMSLQVEIDRMMEKLNKLKAQVQWGEEALLAWSEMVNKGIDEETTIEKFCQEDQARIEELNLERQKLRKEAVEREMELQNVVNGKTAGEFQMQQCGKLYKRALKQYRRHILYWNTSVSFLKDRDAHIKNIHKNITGIKKKAIKVYKDLNSKQKFRQQQIKTNMEVKMQVEETEKKLILMKQAINKVTNQNVEYQTQIKLVQGNLTTLGAKLAEQRSRTSIGQNKLEVKNSEIQQFAETYDQLRHQYERLSSETICQSETNIELEKLSEMTLDTYKAVSKDVEKLQLMLTNLKSELHVAEENATSRTDEIRLSLNTKEKLNKKLNDINVEFNRQQEIVYNSKYTLAKLMSKIAKYEGKQNDLYQKERFMNRIHELEEILENKTGTFQLINNQVKRTEDDLRKMTIEVDKGEAELRHLMDGRQDRLMTVDGGHKKLRNLQDSNQQLQVEQNLLELRVAQVEKNLAKHDDFVFSLEKQRLELESAMREKRLTIQAKKDILFAKKKIIEEEKSELKHSVDHLVTKKYQTQKRYEIAADMLGGGEEKDDNSGESDQVTKFKIKLAQEKSELQSKGDDLDAKIRKSEKEIYAMENTLRLINATNDSYKKNLSSIDSDSPEMEEKRELECKYTASVHNLKQQQQILKNTNESIKALEKSLASTVEMEEKLQSEWRLKDKEVRDLDKELGDQQNKLIRADKQFRKTVREVRALRESSIPIQFAERDIEVRELQEINGCAIQQLLYLASLYVETGPVINRYLDEKGLSIAGFSCDTRRSKLKLGSSSLSLSPSALSSELGANSSRLSVTSERSTPSIINLDPFSTSQISKTSLSGNLSSSQKLQGRKSKK